MAPTSDEIRTALEGVQFPGMSRDIVSFGFVENVEVEGGVVKIGLNIPSGNQEAIEQIAREAHATVSELEGVEEVQLDVSAPMAKGAGQAGGSMRSARRGQAGDSGARGGQPPGGQAPGAGGPGGPGGSGPRTPPPHGGQQGTPLGSGGRPDPGGMFQRDPIPGVKHLLAVASGKGGVGKSTVAVNLAAALSQLDGNVGLMDADIYGPSVPTMLGTHEEPEVAEIDGSKKLVPVQKFGLKLMSLGFLQPEDSPVIWRGPLVMRAVRQFLRDVDWRDTDILVIDLPPGTGDAQLTLTQSAPLDGAIIVTTPQDVALIDARKGLKMFQEVDVPVLGIVENMSVYHCPECGHEAHIFRREGGKRTADELGVPLLGGVPIDPRVAECGDAGTPTVTEYPDSEVAVAFREIAAAVLEGLREKEEETGSEEEDKAAGIAGMIERIKS